MRVGRRDVLELDGLLLDVRDAGPRDGDAAVLLHGFPQDSRCWDSVTPHLHVAGLRTVAPDQRGVLTVLSTPHPRAFAWSLLRSMTGLRGWYTVAVQVPVLPELVLGTTLAPALRLSGLPRETAQQYRARMATPSALAGPLNWYRASARHALVALPLRAGGGDIIHVPATYLWGRSDPALGRTAADRTERYVDGVPRSSSGWDSSEQVGFQHR